MRVVYYHDIHKKELEQQQKDNGLGVRGYISIYMTYISLSGLLSNSTI
jgi:hypothetical protein